MIIKINTYFMTQPIDTSKLVNNWCSLPQAKHAVVLFGLQSTGRTTLAQLIKMYVGKDRSENLKLQHGSNDYKYVLDNVIASKAIKMQTTMPVPYLNAQNNNQMVIIDAPAYCLTSLDKKWSPLDSKISQKMLLAKYPKLSFLIFIKQQNTKSGVGTWKKTLCGFFQLFPNPSKELLNSIGLVISKSAFQTIEDVIINRMKPMVVQMGKEKMFQEYQKDIERLLACLETNRNIYIFKKVNGEPEQQENIKEIYEKITKADFYAHHNDVNLTISTEEEQHLSRFFQNSKQILTYYTDILTSYFQNTSDNQKLEELTQNLSKYYKYDEEPKISDNIKKILQSAQPKSKSKQPLHPMRVFMQFKKQMAPSRENPSKQKQFEADQKMLKGLIQLLPKAGILGTTSSDLIAFELLNQTAIFHREANLSEISNLSDQLLQISSIFNADAANRLISGVYGQIKDAIASQVEVANEFVSLIDQLYDQPKDMSEDVVEFKKECQKNLDPKDMLKSVIEKLNKTDLSQINEVSSLLKQIAAPLMKANFTKQALKIYKAGSHPGQTLQCYDTLIAEGKQVDSKLAQEYIDYLADLTLYEEAKKMCIYLSSKIGNRQQCSQIMSRVVKAQKNYFDSRDQGNIFDPPSKVSSSTIKQIMSIAQKAMEQL